ncbi:MAG: hypothetical protein AAFY20_10355 [Cyanobacteria bacterium J06639_14]
MQKLFISEVCVVFSPPLTRRRAISADRLGVEFTYKAGFEVAVIDRQLGTGFTHKSLDQPEAVSTMPLTPLTLVFLGKGRSR